MTTPQVRTESSAGYPHLEHRGTAPRRRLGPGKPIPGGWLLGPAVLVSIWFLGSATGFIDERTLPAPWVIGSTAADLWSDGRLPENILASLRLASISLVIGVVAGLVMALAAGLSRLGEALLDGPVQIKRAIPTLAIIPLAIMWFGIGDTMKITIIALAVLIPIYINTHAQLRGVDLRHVELAQTVGLSRLEFIRRVALPGAIPGFFTGLRLAVTTSWLALVVVEQINATKGIGYLMDQARTYGQLDIVVVGLVVYGVFGLLSDTLVRLIERRALVWRRSLGS
ncbi:ABC transporter permease [Gordonia sp. (in: high G+C Gram-positive bacteria)]|uniref:ABC transporter permease n=1 Tax=Gordonia sp. (in: high G+C Gram-positive bacteria) TaxID=84139 RepID=UPI0025BE3210|nr:ABC transporter permease [Gordonia sp. (in: high G+C Gram-positive bacteria)]HMS74044.1 ABC transporter permease [Gordonia sp. (in: high G+C Gram-positive bacteria)]HQV17489.1 ABC transporter permease [Gordonia sp. (in: high G+C Gram-positive bacteria)]